MTTAAEVSDIRAEWEDRYGPVPVEAEALLSVADLRAEPWSVLTRFDDAFSAAIADGDLGDAERLASALDAYTASATTAAS